MAIHLKFSAEGKVIIYSLIRKNACSTIRQMISNVSGLYLDSLYITNFRSLFVRTFSDMEASDARFVVLRDPVERAISVFKDAFILNRRGKVAEEFEQLTGVKRTDATFSDFVNLYLAYISRKNLNPHVSSQVSHLAPGTYTHVLRLPSLHTDAMSLFSGYFCDLYLSDKKNTPR